MRRLALLLILPLLGCGGGGGIEIPLDQLLCLATCRDGTCQKAESGAWQCVPNPAPTPTPTPPPQPEDPYPDLPWCHESQPPMTCGACKHQPPNQPVQPAPPCPEPTPTPSPTPPPPPGGGECPFLTPTAADLSAAGVRVEIRPQLEGRFNVSATPMAYFGVEYYCQPGLWPEACAEGRTFGPVAPDGHPYREACEAVFLEAPCPTFRMSRCTGTPNQCPITFDPYYVIGGVNQNHPRNARCDQSTWVPPLGGKTQGQWWIASAHGKGYVEACNGDLSVCTEAKFETDW